MISRVKTAMPIRLSTYFVITIRQPFVMKTLRRAPPRAQSFRVLHNLVGDATGSKPVWSQTCKRQSDQAALPQVFASADYSMVAFLYTRLSATGWNSMPFAPAVIRFALALVYSGAMTASFMTSASASYRAAQRAS